ncbi:MAG: efflux RND transporter permease subunit, partial [Selenomonadaceae bacterium]|nr:efflux RND transporter permease subunit [Selenomonadaceae bacterium]
MAQYFIRHPLQAVVAALLLVLVGTVAAFRLPVAEYPDVAPPMVSVSTTYLGADAEVVRDTVAEVIETEIRGIDGLETMVSRSDASGGYWLDIEFSPGVNGDIAAVNVQNRIASVQSTLPSEVQDNGIDTRRNSPDLVFAMSLCSPKGTYDSIFLQNYAKTHFIDKIKRVSGVGNVMDYTEDYAMRIWLLPDQLAARRLTVADVRAAILEQNVRPAVGVLGKSPVLPSQEKQQIGRVKSRRETPEDFGNIILKAEGSNIVRLKDVARITEGRRDTRYASFQDGKEAAAYGISLMNDANALQTIGEVKKILKEAETFFPPDMEYRIVVDRTKFIQASMEEVLYTFAEALGLVLLIVYLFLGSGRGALITFLAVPVSLIATFWAFRVFGFSINLLTLFAMILAIGLVVDDAIVVIECVSRHRERGLSVREAAMAAMKEVQAPILAIAFVLAAVFLPVAFLEGTTGILYRQFALTIVTAMGISAFAALSLTPALCVLLMDEKKGEHRGENGILGGISRFLKWLEGRYLRFLGGCLRRMGWVLAALLLMMGGTATLYGLLPSEFLPEEDQGYFMAGLNL